MQLDVLRRRAEKIPNVGRSPNLLDDEFRLIPGMNFTCSGKITGLLLGVDVRTVTGNRDQYPVVQIWRLIGNSYDRQDGREIRLAAGDFSPDGVLVYTNWTSSTMLFQSGDVLGVFSPGMVTVLLDCTMMGHG